MELICPHCEEEFTVKGLEKWIECPNCNLGAIISDDSIGWYETLEIRLEYGAYVKLRKIKAIKNKIFLDDTIEDLITEFKIKELK